MELEFIKARLDDYGVQPVMAAYLANLIAIACIFGLCALTHFLTKKIVLRVLAHVILNNRYSWDDIFMEKKVFHKAAHLVPAILVYASASIFPAYQQGIEKAAGAYAVIVTLIVVSAALNAFDDIYRTFEVSKVRPIKGYIQVAKIVIYLVGAILIVASLVGRSPLLLLSGLGALSAVIMLIFKDSILGLVAGVQLSSNDMVRVGDWIEMPKYHADGDVIDISLNTVKVRNFDKTITTIPSYALISDSFRNWRGMQSSGGRRIKRSIFIDTGSIRFCTGEMLEEFRKIHLLADYIEEKIGEIEAHNERNRIDRSSKVNGRQLTNIGVFRVYVQQYLKHHPRIHQEMTLLVRQLASGDTGLPLEIYAFTNDINWAVYESVQSDIFDHIFAVAPEFGLRVFQNPTGYDIQRTMERERAKSL